jgi:hypothetical protein
MDTEQTLIFWGKVLSCAVCGWAVLYSAAIVGALAAQVDWSAWL